MFYNISNQQKAGLSRSKVLNFWHNIKNREGPTLTGDVIYCLKKITKIAEFYRALLKMKDYFKTGCFASKWLIKVEAKGTNQSFGVDIETKLKRRVCVFRWLCVICRSPFCWWDLCQLNFCQPRALPSKTCSLNRGIGLQLNKKIKTDFFQKSAFFELAITQKRFIFEHSYVSYGKRQKSCTLIVIYVILSYLTSKIFNSSSKSTGFFCRRGSIYRASFFWETSKRLIYQGLQKRMVGFIKKSHVIAPNPNSNNLIYKL